VELIAENNGTPIPEPATLPMLLPGLIGVAYGVRRMCYRGVNAGEHNFPWFWTWP
jgi:hypothetical protein